MVQPRGRDVLPAARGHPARPQHQRAQHVRVGHEGQVHQAHPQEGLQVREQVRQAPGEGGQIRLCQPTEGEGQVAGFLAVKTMYNRDHLYHSAGKWVASLKVPFFPVRITLYL